LTAHQALEINGAQCRSGVISHCQAKDRFNHGRYGLASQYPNTVVMAVAFPSRIADMHLASVRDPSSSNVINMRMRSPNAAEHAAYRNKSFAFCNRVSDANSETGTH
jgi:hypothetical protein